MIELIINLIIVVFVVASVLKKFREIAEKGKELDKAPPVPPTAGPDLSDHARGYIEEEAAEPEAPAWPETHEPAVPAVPEMAVGEERRYVEDMWEKMASAESATPEFTFPDVGAATEETPPKRYEPPIPACRFTVPDEKTSMRIDLGFSGEDVVRGIVMSEILGTPVALRKFDHPHLL